MRELERLSNHHVPDGDGGRAAIVKPMPLKGAYCHNAGSTLVFYTSFSHFQKERTFKAYCASALAAGKGVTRYPW